MSGNDVRTPRQLSTSPCALLAGVQWFSTRTSSLERASPPPGDGHDVRAMSHLLGFSLCDGVLTRCPVHVSWVPEG